MSIERMPGVPLSPSILLRKLLENLDQIDGIVCVVQWKGEEFQVCNSAMKTTMLVTMGAYLGKVAMDEFVKEA